MAEDWGEDVNRRAKAALISTAEPNAARVADYLYGGQSNFEADRRAARTLTSAAPTISGIAPAARAFQRRLLRFLVTEAGIRQFLDVGTGLPLVGATHEVAQSLVPACRIVYVDSDPMVLSHARALMRTAPGGAVGYVDADIRDAVGIAAGAREILDFAQPTAVLLLLALAYLEDTAEAAKVVTTLMQAVPSGSYLGLYHLASDLDPAMDDGARQWNKLMPGQPITLRTRAEVDGLLTGLDLVPPGLVAAPAWRPAADDPQVSDAIPLWGAVARKP